MLFTAYFLKKISAFFYKNHIDNNYLLFGVLFTKERRIWIFRYFQWNLRGVRKLSSFNRILFTAYFFTKNYIDNNYLLFEVSFTKERKIRFFRHFFFCQWNLRGVHKTSPLFHPFPSLGPLTVFVLCSPKIPPQLSPSPTIPKRFHGRRWPLRSSLDHALRNEAFLLEELSREDQEQLKDNKRRSYGKCAEQLSRFFLPGNYECTSGPIRASYHMM